MGVVIGSTKALDCKDTRISERRHALDSMMADVILQYVAGQRVLDLGHSNPDLAKWVSERSHHQLTIVDRKQLIHQEHRFKLPKFQAGCFDVIYGLRVFSHFGVDQQSSERQAREILEELSTCLAAGGTLLLQFDNPQSLRGISVGVRNAAKVMTGSVITDDENWGVTRWDTLQRFVRLLPNRLELIDLHAIGLFTTATNVPPTPILSRMVHFLEWKLRDSAIMRHFGGETLAVIRKLHHPRPMQTGQLQEAE